MGLNLQQLPSHDIHFHSIVVLFFIQLLSLFTVVTCLLDDFYMTGNHNLRLTNSLSAVKCTWWPLDGFIENLKSEEIMNFCTLFLNVMFRFYSSVDQIKQHVITVGYMRLKSDRVRYTVEYDVFFWDCSFVAGQLVPPWLLRVRNSAQYYM